IRYCSARGIAPSAIDESVVDGYMRYRAETTALACNPSARRSIARAWNRCRDVVQSWPASRLIEPPIKLVEVTAWEDFPEGLRTDVEAYLGRLSGFRRSAKGKRIKPCSPKTIRRCRAELVAAARMAVRVGIPIDSLNSLGALLEPNVAEQIINAYWQANG